MKFTRILSLLLVLLLAAPLNACAETDIQACIADIYAYVRADADLQTWLDADVAANAGSAADNYIINLSRTDHDLDLKSYIQAAGERLESGEITNPVSRMRCALALLACGAGDRVPAGLADESIGKLGVMSYIFGLHLLSNGAQSQLWSAEGVAERLLTLQKEDGGWAVMGAYGDVDVTAMCLQALSYQDRTDELQAAIERGISFLEQRQLDSAGFSSNGRENSESAAQVLMALTALGIDPQSDARFIRNGKTIVDAVMEYRRASGGFAHLPSEDENETACVQVLQAFTALSQMGTPYYDLSSEAALTIPAWQTSPALPMWKIIFLGAVALLFILGSIFAFTRKRGRMKQFAFIFVITLAAAALILNLNIETAGSYYGEVQKEQNAGTVYLSIRCDRVAGRASDGTTPSDGIILERTELPFADGDTVFDVLTDAARRFKIHIEHTGGTGDMAYINGINHLYEYSYGELSGWVYTVNGERLSVGSGAHSVANGDEIIWHYTLELGEDIE